MAQSFEFALQNVPGIGTLSFEDDAVIALRLTESLSGLPPAPWAAAPVFEFTPRPIGHRPENPAWTPYDGDEPLRLPEALDLVRGPGMPYRLLIRTRLPAVPVATRDLLNRPAKLVIGRTALGGYRYLHGYVAQVRNLGSSLQKDRSLEFLVVPWLAYLGLTRRSKLWSGRSTDIVKELIDGYPANLVGVTEVTIGHAGDGLPDRDPVVQYGESDLDFLCRILERDGIFFYFVHEAEGCRMVLGRDNSAMQAGLLKDRALFLSDGGDDGNELFADLIANLAFQSETVPQRYLGRDYNPLNAAVKLEAGHPAQDTPLTLYEYPAGFTELSDGMDRVMPSRLDGYTAFADLALGQGQCHLFAPGEQCTLPYRPDYGAAPELANSPFIVRRVVHEVRRRTEGGEPVYRNRFEAMSLDTDFCPTRLTPVPRAGGPMSALVTASGGGAAADIDPKSGPLVVYRWDRDEVPVRARLAQNWAGDGRGTYFLPRPGDEVLVEFVDGDLERPVVVGSVHNSRAAMVHDPSRGGTISDVSASDGDHAHLTGLRDDAGNRLELYDKQGQERVMLYAEGDRDDFVKGTYNHVSAMRFEKVTEDFALTVKGNMQYIVEGDLQIVVRGNLDIKLPNG